MNVLGDIWRLVAAKNAARFPLGSESASALYFYDCFKQGLKLGCRSPNEAPGRLPLIQSKLTPSLPSTRSVLVFLKSVDQLSSGLTARLPFGHRG